MQIKYPLKEQTENTGYQCFEDPNYESHIHRVHKGVSGATFTLQDRGRGSSADDQCSPGTHGRKAGLNNGARTEAESSALRGLELTHC